MHLVYPKLPWKVCAHIPSSTISHSVFEEEICLSLDLFICALVRKWNPLDVIVLAFSSLYPPLSNTIRQFSSRNGEICSKLALKCVTSKVLPGIMVNPIGIRVAASIANPMDICGLSDLWSLVNPNLMSFVVFASK